MQKGHLKKNINAWAMYDWGNSAYNLVITTTFFPVFFIESTRNAFHSHTVSFFSFSLPNNVLYDYTLAFAYGIVMLITPLLAATADTLGNRFKFLKIFTLIGTLSCSSLFFFNGRNIEIGCFFFFLATIGYASSLIFYNAYLPHIAPKYLHDKISAKGFIYGYIGSVILQGIGLILLLLKPFQITESVAIRITFLLVGVWWFCFAQYAFFYLKKITHPIPLSTKNTFQILKNSYKKIGIIFTIILKTKPLRQFLSGFFFYSMGMETLMLIAINFGKKELKIPSEYLILTAILLQVVAILGARIFTFISKKINNLPVLFLLSVLWTFICIGGYFTQTPIQFYGLSFFVGLIMGATQTLSRSTYSKTIPYPQKAASFFTFYDLLRNLSLVIGLFLFGFIEQITHNIRHALLFLILLFLTSLFILLYTQIKTKKA